MNIERGRITVNQLFFLCLGFVQGSALALAFISKATKQNAWLAIIGGFCWSLPFIFIYLKLAGKFPGRNLIQIHNLVYGPYLGKLVSLFYIWLFWSLVSLNLRVFGDFFLNFVMPETPLIIFIIPLTIACAFTVSHGLETLTRTCVYYVVIYSVTFIIDTLLLAGNMRISNLLPIPAIPGKVILKGMHTVAAVPILETIVFLMVFPYSKPARRVAKSYIWSVIVGVIILLATSLRNIMVLGSRYPLVYSPTYETVRLIYRAKIFTRMELLTALGLLVTQFTKISVLYYATVLSLAQILIMRSYKPLILPVGSVAAGLAILVFQSSIEQAYSGSHYYPIYTIPFEFIIPALTLLIAIIRGLPKNVKGNEK